MTLAQGVSIACPLAQALVHTMVTECTPVPAGEGDEEQGSGDQGLDPLGGKLTQVNALRNHPQACTVARGCWVHVCGMQLSRRPAC